MLLVEAIPRTGDRNLMTMALADEQMIFFVRGPKTFALGGTNEYMAQFLFYISYHPRPLYYRFHDRKNDGARFRFSSDHLAPKDNPYHKKGNR